MLYTLLMPEIRHQNLEHIQHKISASSQILNLNIPEVLLSNLNKCHWSAH